MSGVTNDPYLRRKVVARRQPKPEPKPCKRCGKPLSTYFLTGHNCKEPANVSTDIDAFLDLDGVPRDQWDRPLVVPPTGGDPIPYMRVSTFADTLSNGNGLVYWKSRLAARGMAYREDIAALVAGLKFSTNPDKKQRKKEDAKSNKELDKLIEEAIASIDDSARYGTAVHAFTEPEPSAAVPARMQPDVASYQRALLTHQLVCVESETFVVHDELKLGGSFDGIYEHPTLGRMIGDKKTGDIKPTPLVIQLACYAGAQRYDHETLTRTALDVRQDVGLLFHIPKGKGATEVYLVPLDAGRRAAAAAAWLCKWRADEDDLLMHFNELTIADLKAAS